jgi:hypothetical protein
VVPTCRRLREWEAARATVAVVARPSGPRKATRADWAREMRGQQRTAAPQAVWRNWAS